MPTNAPVTGLTLVVSVSKAKVPASRSRAASAGNSAAFVTTVTVCVMVAVIEALLRGDVLRQFRQQRAELQLAEEIDDALAVVLVRAARLQIEAEFHIRDDRRQHLALQRVLVVRHDDVADARRHDLVQVVAPVLQRAELLEQRRRRLPADPLDAGDVVALVADERLVVRDEWRREAVSLDRLRHIVDTEIRKAVLRAGQNDIHAIVRDELERIGIARDDVRLDALARRHPAERADHVVRLVAGDDEDRDIERLDDLADALLLLPQFVRHRRAVRLVGIEQIVAEGAALVEGDGDVGRGEGAQRVQHHRGEAEGRIDEFAGRGRHRLRQRVESAIKERVTINEHDPFFRHVAALLYFRAKDWDRYSELRTKWTSALLSP